MLRLVICFFCFSQASSERKIWKHDNDVMNPKNWKDVAGTAECRGFVFPDVLGSVGSIVQMRTSEILLPISGELEIQNGGYVEFSSADQKCVRVKELTSRRWLDPNNWECSENVARPDAEKVPCVYDDVVFASQDVGVLYPEVSVSVRSIQIKDVRLTDEQWQNFLGTDYGIDQFQEQDTKGGIQIEDRTCGSGGCTCHDRQEETLSWICDGAPKNRVQCFRPIRPVGFCSDVCGGVVYLNVSARFSLAALLDRLPKQVDVYASKVWLGQSPASVVQVIFMEKFGYTEKSAEVAQDFYKSVVDDLAGFRVVGASVKTSGISLPQGSASATSLAIVFGTFAAVVLCFLGLYVVYLGPLRDYDLASRVPLSQFLLGKRRQYFFNKFENREMSRATSMASLQKSFDNPMYDAVASTSTGNTKEPEAVSESTD